MSDMVTFNGVKCTFEEWARLESEYKAKIDIQARLVGARREGAEQRDMELLSLIAKGLHVG